MERFNHFVSDLGEELIERDMPFAITIENMGCRSFSDAPKWNGIMSDILEKYRNKKPKAIVLLGQEAWSSFLSQKEASLFSDVPFFSAFATENGILMPDETTDISKWTPKSVNMRLIASDKRISGGVLNRYSVNKNIELITSMFPKTKFVALISDNTYGGVSINALFRDRIKLYPNLYPIFIDGRSMTINQAINRIHSLPENCAILWGSWRVDKDDNYSVNATYDRLYDAIGERPIFSLSSSNLKQRIIGGYIPDYIKNHSKQIATDIYRYYASDGSHPIKFTVADNLYRFSFPQIAHHEINISNLPYPHFIEDKPLTGKDIMQPYIFVICIILIALLIFIAVIISLYVRLKHTNTTLLNENNLRAQREAELFMMKVHAEESDRLKSAFLANMSHEIRTPLNAIVGFSEIIGELAHPESLDEVTEYVEIIRTNNNMLLQLIGDILDISKIETGVLDYNFKKTNINKWIYEIRQNALLRVTNPNVDVRITEEIAELYILTDPNRLAQVLMNFINNAVKYTENGYIDIGFREARESNMIFFYCKDTGSGIPMEKTASVFERFVKLDPFKQGTGIGLSICQNIVETMGGKIGVKSTPGVGSEFWFVVPITPTYTKNEKKENRILATTYDI